MTKEKSVEQDFNLNEDRPLAGEVRKYPLGEAIFFSPKPVPSTNVIPGGLGESNKILEINDVYMDIGQSSNGKALQVQLVMSCIVFMAIVFFSVFIVLAVSDKYMYDSFFHALWSSLKEEGGIAFSPILFLLCIGWYVIISSSLKNLAKDLFVLIDNVVKYVISRVIVKCPQLYPGRKQSHGYQFIEDILVARLFLMSLLG